MRDDLEKILFEEEIILRRLDALAAEILRDYQNRELTLIVVLNGSFIFAADLLRRLPQRLQLGFLSVASYQGGTKSTGKLVLHPLPLPQISGRDILILEDVLDSGLTLGAILEELRAQRPASIKVCVLLRKEKVRLRQVEPDYVGFEIGDEFVVGYGLDHMEHYRNLPCIGVLRNELIAES